MPLIWKVITAYDAYYISTWRAVYAFDLKGNNSAFSGPNLAMTAVYAFDLKGNNSNSFI